MNAKLISDGTPNGSRVIMDDGTNLEGIVSVRWSCDGPDRLPVVEAELLMMPIEANGVLSVVAHHPEGGIKQVAKIVFADGNEWVAP